MNTVCNDILWLVLKTVPLNQLLPLRLVCQQWNLVIRKLCLAKKSLILHGPQNGPSQVGLFASFDCPENQISLFATNLETKPRFASLFPNVIKLVIWDDYFQAKLYRIDRLVIKWSQNLTSLTIHGLSSTISSTKLSKALNSLNCLTELHLLYLYDYIDLTKIQILCQLKYFSLVRYFGDIVPVLAQLSPTKCQRLVLDKVQLTSNHLKQAISINSQLGINLKYLSIGPLCVTEKDELRPVLGIICAQFKALTYLYTDFAFQVRYIFTYFSLAIPKHISIYSCHWKKLYHK